MSCGDGYDGEGRNREGLEIVRTTTSLLDSGKVNPIINTEGGDCPLVGTEEKTERDRGMVKTRIINGVRDKLEVPGCLILMLVDSSKSMLAGDTESTMCEYRYRKILQSRIGVRDLC